MARRTDAEERLFKRALGNMQALYFHAKVDALIMQQVPVDSRNNTRYERGWTAMECAGACLSRVTPDSRLSGIDFVFDMSMPPSVETFEELKHRKFTNGSGPVLDNRAGFGIYARREEAGERSR